MNTELLMRLKAVAHDAHPYPRYSDSERAFSATRAELTPADVLLLLDAAGRWMANEAEIESLTTDANRYRFLRGVYKIPISTEAARDPVAYDAAIDKAMKRCEVAEWTSKGRV